MFGFWVLFYNFLFSFYAFTSHCRNTWNKNALFVSCYSLGFVCCFLWRTPPHTPTPSFSVTTFTPTMIWLNKQGSSDNQRAGRHFQLGELEWDRKHGRPAWCASMLASIQIPHSPPPPSPQVATFCTTIAHGPHIEQGHSNKYWKFFTNIPLPTRPYHQIVSGSVANWFQMAEPTLFKFALSWAARAVQKALMPVLIPNSILLHYCQHRHHQCSAGRP